MNLTFTLTKVFVAQIFMFQKYISVCCTLIVMVLALGVIVEESTEMLGLIGEPTTIAKNSTKTPRVDTMRNG